MSPREYPRSILGTRSRGGRRVAAGARRCRRPVIEAMESRRLLSTITEFPVPTPLASLGAITTGSDGQLWFTEFDQIGSIDPSTHHIDEYAIPTPNAEPTGIAAGPDGKLWFTEPAGKIGMFDPITHHLFEFAIPTPHSEPTAIATGPDGKLWFTEGVGDRIGTIDPYTHAINEYALPTSDAFPDGIAAGPDGHLWFTEFGADQIGSIDPDTHQIAEYAIPTAGSDPHAIVAGPGGFLWFTELTGNNIGTIDPASHVITETTVPGTKPTPAGIAAGPDGNVWFTEAESNVIGRIDPTTDSISESAIPTANAQSQGIAAGPDGNLWFTEFGADQIGVLQPRLSLSVVSGPPAAVVLGAAFGLSVSVSYQAGRPDPGFDGDVTLALADPGGATLGGTITVAARQGVATFAGLSIDRPGTYRIVASFDAQTTTMTAPVAVEAPPTIVAAGPILAGKGRHRRLVGYELDFSAAMDPARAASLANYSVVQYRRRHRRLIAKPVRFRASYDAAAHRVELTFSGRPKFAAGGKLAVVGTPPSGLTDAAGTLLDGGDTGASGDDASLLISPMGRALLR